MDIKEIEIPIFLHPHLFWIFWRKDTKKRLQLENDIAKEYSKTKQKDKNFYIGEVVVMNKNLMWKRAIIEDVVEGNSYKYEVWLVDHGHLEHTDAVYKLKSKFNLIQQPALAQQASLCNVVFINEDLNFENDSIDHHKNTVPNAGATLIALQFLNDHQLFFRKSREINGVFFGDVFYKKDGETSSLTKALIDRNVMVVDEELFSKVETNRINNKHSHLQALRQASKKHEDARFSFDLSLLMDEVFMRNTSRGISLASDCELQSENRNSTAKKMSKIELLRNLRKKSEMRKMEVLSCTESEMEETPEGGRNFSRTPKKSVSNMKYMVNSGKPVPKVEQSYAKEATSDLEANVAVNKNIQSAASKFAALKLRTRKQKEKENLDVSEPERSGGDVPDSKLLRSPYSVFIPGGLRIKSKKKATTKSSLSDSENSSRKSFEMKNSNNKDTLKMKKNYQNNKNMKSSQERKPVHVMDSSWSNTSDASDADVLKNINSNTSRYADIKESNETDDVKELRSTHSSGILNNKENRNSIKNEEEKSNSVSCDSDIERRNPQPEQKAENKISEPQPSAENVDSVTSLPAAESQMVVKPFCSCSQCQFWTTSETWEQGGERFTEEEICKRKKMRPSSLMLKGERTEDVKLASVDYRCMTKIEKEASLKILVHGRLIPQPIDFVAEAPFHTSIHRSLSRLKYTRTKKIQSFVWPAISRSMNVYYIHRKKAGKTLAYLPPVCSFLLEREERYNDLKKGGPLAVILGKSSAQCEEIYDLANKLVEGVGPKRPRILLVTYPFQYVNMSSVDMLITIPPILIELLKKNATNLKRLCHLVLENTDVLLDKYSENMKLIVTSIESMLLQRGTRQNVQMIMCGEHWTLKVEKFLMRLRDVPIISIGDYLEASIYGGITLKVKLLAANAKCDAVVDILKDTWKFHKSVIICNTNEEIELIKTSLDLVSISYIGITDDLDKDEICQNEINWETKRGGEYSVLLCTDEVLHTMLSITSASLLIHYSLPSKWSFWVKRFYCLLENYKCPLTTVNDKLKCEGYILTDEMCVDQIPRLLSLLKNYNVSLKQFEPVCKQIEIQKEEVKINDEVPLCTSLKQFGYCNIERCPARHLLDTALDRKSSLPQNGTIKYKIIKLIDVNHLKVHIVEHKDIEGKITEYISRKEFDDEKLTAILNQKRERAENIEKQSSYAYWDEEDFNDMFRECIVEDIKSDVVDILVTSSGKRTVVSKSKIFRLPEEPNKVNESDSHSTDIIIANFKPPYKDETFSARAYFKLNCFIEDVGFNDSVFVSNICLQLGDTIWVNTVSEEVNVYDWNLTKTNLTKELVKRNLAETNREHIENLYSLCEEADIVLPQYVVPVQEKIIREPPQATPQWAFLEMDICNKIYFSSAVTPDELYVRLVKFDSLLDDLEKDLTEVAARQGSNKDFAIIQGRFYLAKDPIEEKYIRVLIKQIEGGKAMCFSVDYGDEFIAPLEDIRYLSNYMIEKLPFQAIHCRLFGITPIEGEWPVEVVDVLYKNFTFETDSDIYRTLYAKCIIYERGLRKGQSFFSIILKDACETPILINQLFIDCGWAELIAEAKLVDFEVPDATYDSEEELLSDIDNDELEKVKGILEASKTVSSNQVVPKIFNSTSSGNHDENELEFFCGASGDEVDTFINFMTSMVKTSEEIKAKTPTTCSALPAIKAAPFEVDYLTPDVFWSQTNKLIDLYIKLPNVKTYKIKILKSRIFNFETTVEGKKYVVNLVLYESVEKEFKESLGGLEVKITLKKKKEEEWYKLSRSKKRLRNVHYMLSKEEMNDDETDKLFLDFGEDMKVETDPESDGAIFDVYSDVDSEYEQDLAEDPDF